MNLRKALIGASCAAATLAAVAPASALATSGSSTLKKESLEVDSRSADATLTSKPLKKYRNYLVTVDGVASFVSQSIWAGGARPFVVPCGTPVAIPYLSPGQPAGVGGIDPEVLIAGVAQFGCGNFKPPIAGTQFQLSTDGGTTYVNPDAIGGPYTAPRAGNSYSYIITGEGASKAAFKIVDGNRADNNGVFKISIRRASNSACLFGGAQDLGFATFKECIKTVDAYDFDRDDDDD